MSYPIKNECKIEISAFIFIHQMKMNTCLWHHCALSMELFYVTRVLMSVIVFAIHLKVKYNNWDASPQKSTNVGKHKT